MKLVESIRKLAEELSEIELAEQFQQEIERSGYYDVLAEARPSSRPMQMFSGNADAQRLISFLHRKKRLSSRASFQAHDRDQRLPWKELKQSPDSYMIFFGPNGMAAAHPSSRDSRDDDEGVPSGYRSGQTSLEYEVYYLLNDREDIFLDVYKTRRGGLPNKRDQRNPDNIADFIRDKLGVRGSFPAIYISGPVVKPGGSGLAEPVTDDDLRQRTARLRREYEPEERAQDPEADDATIEQRVNTRIRDQLQNDPDLRTRVQAVIQKLKDEEPYLASNEDQLRKKVRNQLRQQGLGWIYSGRRSLARTEPGASVERGKIQMRRDLQSADKEAAVERVSKVIPSLISQWKVKMIRSRRRDLVDNLPSDVEQRLKNDAEYEVGRWIRNKQREAATNRDRDQIAKNLRQELSYNIKNDKMINDIVDIYTQTGNVDVPDDVKQRDINLAVKLQRLSRTALDQANRDYLEKEEQEIISRIAAGSRNELDDLLKAVRASAEKELTSMAS